MKAAALVVMRLHDMHRGHPAQDNTKVCSSCGAGVGIYPSGQSALKGNPGMAIVCSVCMEKERDPYVRLSMPAAPWDEIVEELRESGPKKP